MAEREYIEIVTSVKGGEEVDKLNVAVNKLGNESQEASKKIDKFDESMGNATNQAKTLRQRLSELTQNFKNVKQENDKIPTSLGDVVKKYAGITAVVAGVKKATDVFTAFDDEIRKVQATSGATSEQMNTLRNQAKELGRTTRWSASEAAETQFEFAKAGFQANEIYNATPGILNTATAGQLSLAEATEITAGTLRMFNLSANESQRVGDVLAMTANASTTDVRGLGESLKYAGLGAHGFKMSLEETAAVLGVLGNRKIDSSMAGTGLRAVFSTLKDKNKIKLLADLDIQLTENGEYRNFLKIFDDIKQKTSGMAKAQREAYLDQVFGREGGQVISALMATPQAEFDELLKKLNDSKGYSQKVAEIFDSGLGGSFKNLSSAVEGFSISLMENLAPTFITVTNAVTRVINTLTTFFEWLNSGSFAANTLSGIIVGLTAVYTGHVVTLKAVALWTMINTAYKKSDMAQTIVSTGIHYAHATALGVQAMATKIAAGATWLLNGALSFLTAPVLLVIAAGIGLGAIFYDLYKRSETFRNSVNWLIDKLKILWGYIKKFTGLGIVIDVGKSAINGIKDFFGFGKKKNQTLQDTAQDEVKKTNAVIGDIPQTVGENTDYLLLSGGATKSTDNYKHNGYYLKGSKVINNSSNTSSNVYSENISSENKVPEKTMEEKILDTLLSIKDLLSSKNSDSSRVQINVSKNDKEDIISQVVEDLTIALGNM